MLLIELKNKEFGEKRNRSVFVKGASEEVEELPVEADAVVLHVTSLIQNPGMMYCV